MARRGSGRTSEAKDLVEIAESIDAGECCEDELPGSESACRGVRGEIEGVISTHGAICLLV
jgi:hypothetical protein